MIRTYIYKSGLLLLFFAMHSFTIRAQDTTETSYQDRMNSSFSIFQKSQQESFQSFKDKQQKAFDEFKEEVEKKWGDQNFLCSDSVSWVEYNDDNESRSLVNFKEGTATVNVIVNADEAENQEAINNKFVSAIETLNSSKGKLEDAETKGAPENQLSEEAILKGQLVDENGNKVDNSNIGEFAQSIVEQNEIATQEIKGADGEARVMLSITIPLAPDYLKVRAEKLLPLITKYAYQYGIEPELILGIIHIESYFNPKAISHANAIGLMQLVPSSGGLDSYEYVYGKNVQPSLDFLYNPENNIHLGAAYLQKIMNVYFKNISDPKNKLYCSIASYNTGVGNLCYAVTKTTKITPSVNEINKMDPQTTYDYLVVNLKYEEARNYLMKVNEKYLMYQGWVDY